MNYQAYLQVWYFVLLIPISVITYYALMAIDFSKIFKANSTWQIRVLAIIISLVFGFVIADGILGILDRILSTL